MYIPIFIVWDETLAQSYAQIAIEKIKEFTESLLPSLKLQTFIHITYLAGSGASSSGKQYYKVENIPYGELRSDVRSSGELSYSISHLPLSTTKAIVEQNEGVKDSLPPLVLTFFNRRFVDVHSPNMILKSLFSNELAPRVAMFGTSEDLEWELLSEIRSQKQLLVTSFSKDVSEISTAFEIIGSYVQAKLNEFSGRPEVATSSGKSPAPSVATPPVSTPAPQPPPSVVKDESARPVIVLNDSSALTPIALNPSAPERPTISITQRDEMEIKQTTASTQSSDENAIPSVTKLSEAESPLTSSTSDSVSSPIDDNHSPDNQPKRKESAWRFWPFGKSAEEKEKDVSRSEGQSVGNPSVELSVDEKPETSGLNGAHPPSVPSSFPEEPVTADGQIVIDHSSSLNAKPWYSPNWKKLPRRRGLSRDIEIDLGSLQDLRVIAGSTRGTKHQYYADENQDSFHVAYTEDSTFLIVAVADGVGSAEFSAYGSRLVSYFVAEAMADSLSNRQEVDSTTIRQLLGDAVAKASDRMQHWRTEEIYAPPMEPTPENKNIVSSTLCAAVIPVTAGSDGSRSIVLACVGDSPCYTLNGLEWTLRSRATKEGAVLEHGTNALPSDFGKPPNIDFFEFVMFSKDMLILMTDGIGTSLESGDTAVGRWLAPRLNSPLLMTDFIHVLDFVQTLTADRQGEDDDRTLAVIYDFEGVTQVPQESVVKTPPNAESAVVVDTGQSS